MLTTAQIAKEEFAKAKKAGFDAIIEELKSAGKKEAAASEEEEEEITKNKRLPNGLGLFVRE